MVDVLIVDDHAIVRQGLRGILVESGMIASIEEAADELQTMEKLSQSSGYDLILLDVSLKGVSGIDLLRQIHAIYPEQKVLILSMHPEERYGIAALRAGANGYLSKDCSAEELTRAVSQIIDRGRYISESLADVLAETAAKPSRKLPHELLSEREYQTFIMIASGMSPTEIARVMGLSIKTISVYRTRLLDKMQLKNTAELVHYAVNHGLLESNDN